MGAPSHVLNRVQCLLQSFWDDAHTAKHPHTELKTSHKTVSKISRSDIINDDTAILGKKNSTEQSGDCQDMPNSA
jgi:hypothetical protein